MDLDDQDYHEVSKLIIKEKDAMIKELHDNMAKAQFVISFLEQENKQLKDKQVLMELEPLKEKIQDIKGKEMMAPDDSDHYDTQTIKSTPKRRGLKGALE